MRMSHAFIVIPALAGTVLGAIAYLAPNTGVDGTAGALLALIGATAVTLGGLLGMMLSGRGWVTTLLDLLLGAGALLTAAAAYFLMQYLFAAAMALAVAGLLLAVGATGRRTA